MTTDSAPVITGDYIEMASLESAKVKEYGEKAYKLHRILHQEALCAQTV